MSSAIVSLILVALMITSGLTYARVAISSVDDLNQSWQNAQKADLEQARSEFALVGADALADKVNILVSNTGLMQLTNYRSWDVIAQYYDQNGVYRIEHLTFVSGSQSGANQWAVNCIYADQNLTQAEVFQPGIIDPGEVAKLQLSLSPAPSSGRFGWVIIATDKGLRGSIQFHS